MIGTIDYTFINKIEVIGMVDEKKDTTKKLQELLKKRGSTTVVYEHSPYKSATKRSQQLSPESYSYTNDD